MPLLKRVPTFVLMEVAVVSGAYGLFEHTPVPSLVVRFHLHLEFTNILRDLILSFAYLSLNTVLLILSIFAFVLQNLYALLIFMITIFWLT